MRFFVTSYCSIVHRVVVGAFALSTFFLAGINYTQAQVFNAPLPIPGEVESVSDNENQPRIIPLPEETDSAPAAPVVESKTFFDPEMWFNETSGLFTWELPDDVEVMAMELATSSTHEPFETFRPPVALFEVSENNLIEGVQYLSVQFKNSFGWGEVTNHPIKIDTLPPSDLRTRVQERGNQAGFPLLFISAEDDGSGIKKYELSIPGKEPISISPEEARVGYLLQALEDGTYTLGVAAYDEAGNVTTDEVAVLITAGWTKPTPAGVKPAWEASFNVQVLISALVFLLLFLLGYIFYQAKEARLTERRLRKETAEIQDQMEKIFSALRDEIYDQIKTLTVRPRMSKKEQEAIHGLNQALKVSETLIGKEIKDVKDILK